MEMEHVVILLRIDSAAVKKVWQFDTNTNLLVEAELITYGCSQTLPILKVLKFNPWYEDDPAGKACILSIILLQCGSST